MGRVPLRHFFIGVEGEVGSIRFSLIGIRRGKGLALLSGFVFLKGCKKGLNRGEEGENYAIYGEIVLVNIVDSYT